MAAHYPTLVGFHVLLLVIWLGAALGGTLLVQQARKRDRHAQSKRRTIPTLLVIVDTGPRFALALMVPSSLLLLKLGPWWPTMPDWLLWAGLAIGPAWVGLVWYAHIQHKTQMARQARVIEAKLKWLLAGFYLVLGWLSLANGAPLAGFLAWKALLFGLLLLVAVAFDVALRPVGSRPTMLVSEGSSDLADLLLWRTMVRKRIVMLLVYLLLLATSWLGITRGVPLM